MPADYLLSVDLGTSHTVAVVVWPDGRTRPLLFDGSPVMPSAVFLDPAGTLHTGRDAERLALTAPERFEPNPKQRISDRTILLGDREIPVTAAFAAILSRVARTAVESVGHLPNAVLTCPAAWSEQRRAALHDAAAQAGYRPVKLITEPVAAAHYYTSRLSHQVAPGQALAVFDFGGGTLDIAVLERRPDGSFGVLADGGLPDLGGLDFDAALVAHIGETVRQREPEIWKRLENPSGASELRNRRELWEEVRGAKEMLSRSSVAPVTVPDMAQSLHLTRGELDQISRPLLARAVGETQRVLGLTGRRPEQLAGLFLVGGSSRMPMVSKVLHEGLGIAPTVLEQPELPVSEGAALAMTSAAPVTPPAPMPSPPPQLTAPSIGLPPVTPGSDQTIPLRRSGDDQSPPVPPRRGTEYKARRIPPKWIAIGVTAVVLIAAVTIGLWWALNPYKQRPFADELREVGAAEPLSGEVDDGIYEVRSVGDRSALFYTTSSEDESGQELHVRAVDNRSGELLWDAERVLPGDGWNDTFFVSEELIAFSQEIESGAEYRFVFLDWDTGEVHTTVTSWARDAARSGELLVIAPVGGNAFEVYDAEGEQVSSWQLEGEETVAQWNLVGTPDDIAEPTRPANGDGRLLAVSSIGVTHVFDVESGETVAAEEIETVEDRYFAWNERLYVTVDKETGYDLNVYSVEDLSEVHSVWIDSGEVAPAAITACGETLVCVGELVEDQTGVYHWRVYDADAEEIVHEFDDREYGWIEPLGDRVMAEYYAGDDVRTQIYSKNFESVNNSLEETFDPIDGGSALAWPGRSTFGTAVGNVIGLGRDGTRAELRTELEVYGCDATDTRLVCLTPAGSQVYSFRDE